MGAGRATVDRERGHSKLRVSGGNLDVFSVQMEIVCKGKAVTGKRESIYSP